MTYLFRNVFALNLGIVNDEVSCGDFGLALLNNISDFRRKERGQSEYEYEPS